MDSRNNSAWNLDLQKLLTKWLTSNVFLCKSSLQSQVPLDVDPDPEQLRMTFPLKLEEETVDCWTPRSHCALGQVVVWSGKSNPTGKSSPIEAEKKRVETPWYCSKQRIFTTVYLRSLSHQTKENPLSFGGAGERAQTRKTPGSPRSTNPTVMSAVFFFQTKLL